MTTLLTVVFFLGWSAVMTLVLAGALAMLADLGEMAAGRDDRVGHLERYLLALRWIASRPAALLSRPRARAHPRIEGRRPWKDR